MTKCKRHQWCYIKNSRIGSNPYMGDREEYARWLCPYCGEEKFILIRRNPYGEESL